MHYISNPTEKPTLDLTGLKKITVKAGQPLKIAVPVKGHPPPVASWEKDGKDIESGPKTNLSVSPV